MRHPYRRYLRVFMLSGAALFVVPALIGCPAYRVKPDMIHAPALPSGEKLVQETPLLRSWWPCFQLQRDPNRSPERLWLVARNGRRSEVQLPKELAAPAPLDDGHCDDRCWWGVVYTWPSRNMFVFSTHAGIYGIRKGEMFLISNRHARSTTERPFLSAPVANFRDMGPDADAVVIDPPENRKYYILNEQKGIIETR